MLIRQGKEMSVFGLWLINVIVLHWEEGQPSCLQPLRWVLVCVWWSLTISIGNALFMLYRSLAWLLLSVPLIQIAGDKQQCSSVPKRHREGTLSTSYGLKPGNLRLNIWLGVQHFPAPLVCFEVHQLRLDIWHNMKNMGFIFFFSLWHGRCGFFSATLIRDFRLDRSEWDILWRQI